MSYRPQAVEQYASALRMGRRYYSACVARGQSPYPAVLEDILTDKETAGQVQLGLVEIPIERITGTWADGRKAAFAGNFMPLLDVTSEFGSKWVSLCEAHLEEGINDPIVCYEYLGNFYVLEGHKRVSVLRSFDAASVMGQVTRIVPAPSDDPDIQLYYEFMDFYRASRLYLVSFSRPGSYARLQAMLGFEPGQQWSEEARRAFSSDFRRFSAAFDHLNSERLPLTAGDAFLTYLHVHPYSEMSRMTSDETLRTLTALWPDIRLLAKGAPVSVSTEPERKEKSLLGRILGGPRLHAAFIYDFDPAKSPWASAHEQGEKYLREKMGDSVTVTSHLCGDDPLQTMEDAIVQGANVIFATTPTLIDACRRIAAEHKNVAVYNCSLSLPYAGVRGYYCRIYESKYIAGAIAGAMTREDRIGYVANYPIMGTIAAVNAFALGARLTNPRAQVRLRWSCLPGNPMKELLDQGVDVISNRDEDGAKSVLSWHLGTYQVQSGGQMLPLAAPRWNWGAFYEKTLRMLQSGGIEAVRDSSRAITDWWGIRAGVVNVDLADSLPGGMKRLARILEDGIVREEINPFQGPLRDQQGRQMCAEGTALELDEVMRMNWLCDGIEGVIPAFDELLPQSRNLVRLLGVNRESIPPKTEEAAL